MAEERKLAHLNMIQGVVSRMAANSFQLKGWAVLLVSGLFGLAAVDANRRFALVAFLPTIAFWALDAYYLRQERLFRRVYERVIELADQDIDFSMNTQPFAPKVAPTWRVATSLTILWFYLPLLITVLIVSIAIE